MYVYVCTTYNLLMFIESVMRKRDKSIAAGRPIDTTKKKQKEHTYVYIRVFALVFI